METLIPRSVGSSLRTLASPLELPTGEQAAQIVVFRYIDFIPSQNELEHIVSLFFCNGPKLEDQCGYEFHFALDVLGEVIELTVPEVSHHGDVVRKRLRYYNAAESEAWMLASLEAQGDDFLSAAAQGTPCDLSPDHALNRPLRVMQQTS